MATMINTATAPRSVQDDYTGNAADPTGDLVVGKRKQVSKRAFIDKSGNPVDNIDEATGARYTLLAPSGNKDFDIQLGEAGKAVTMFAIFGAHTKLGNVANTVLNDKDEPGSPDDAASEIEDFIKMAEGGVWREKSAGPVGTRIDKDALAAAIVAVAEAAGKSPDYQKIRDRLESDPQYVRTARSVTDVQNEYARRVGKAGKSIDDLI